MNEIMRALVLVAELIIDGGDKKTKKELELELAALTQTLEERSRAARDYHNTTSGAAALERRKRAKSPVPS